MTTYNNFSWAWVEELWKLIDGTPGTTAPRGLPIRETRWSQFSVLDPMSFPINVVGRDFRHVIGVLEALSLVGQFNIPELFTRRVSKFNDFLDDGVFHGAYSTRAHGAVGDLVNLMKRDPDTRQGVISVFDSSRDLDRQKKDIPCTIALHFMQRDGGLEMNAIMRSNDIWLGTPYDFTQFAVLQASVAQALNIQPSTYIHSASSLHLYERDLPSAEKVSREKHGPSMPFPLWSAPASIAEISKRARDLALDEGLFLPGTEFEKWAWDLLHG